MVIMAKWGFSHKAGRTLLFGNGDHEAFIFPPDMEIIRSRWGLLSANSSRGKNHLSLGICSTHHPLAEQIFGAMPGEPGEEQCRESPSLSGNSSSWPAMITAQGLLMAWGQTSWSWSCIILIPATGKHRNKHMAVILGLSLPKDCWSFGSEER